MDEEQIPGKLTGETLNTDQLLEALPFLNEILTNKELSRSQLENFAKGAAVLRRFRAGDVVCEEGDFGSTAFYIISGKVEVSINNPLGQLQTRRAGSAIKKGFAQLKRMTSFFVHDNDAPQDAESKKYIPIDAPVDLPRERPIAELGATEIFGEMTCRTFQPRSATVTCTEECVMVEMLRVILDMLTGNRAVSDAIKSSTRVKAATFKGSPTFRKMVEDKYRERSLSQHLRSVPMFASLGEEFLNELKSEVELVNHGAGDDIVKQGDPADAFYLIRTGMVKVVQAMPGGEIVRTYMSRGDFFGEIGLIQPDGKRVATCRALDQTDLVRIGRPLFEKILEKFPQVRVELKMVADARLRAIAARQIPTGMNMDEFLDQGLFEAQNLLLIDLDKCTRCDACVNACAEAHDGVTRLLRDGLRYDRYLVATACRSCHDPLCMTQCPVGSIRRKDSLEIKIESWCIGCSKCADLCPYGNINMHPVEVPAKKPAPAKAAPAPAAAAAAGAAKAAPAAAAPAGVAKPAPPAAGAPAAKAPALAAAAKPAAPAPVAAATSAPTAVPAIKPAAAPVTPPAIAAAQPAAFNDVKAPSAVPLPAAAPAPNAGQPPVGNGAAAPGNDKPNNAAARYPASADAIPAKEDKEAAAALPPSMQGPRDNRPEADPSAVSADPLLKATPATVAAKPATPGPAAGAVAAKAAVDPDPAVAADHPATAPNIAKATAAPGTPAAVKPPGAETPAAAAKPAAAPAAAAVKPAAAAPAAKPAAPAPAKPAAAAAKPAAPAAAAAKPAAAPAKSGEAKKPTKLVATTCDLCTDLLTPSCVYACPHDAAMRIDPSRYFAGQKSAQNRHKRSWISRLFFSGEPDNRTTH